MKTLADEWRVYVAMPRVVVDAGNEVVAEARTAEIAAEIVADHNREILAGVRTTGMLLAGRF